MVRTHVHFQSKIWDILNIRIRRTIFCPRIIYLSFPLRENKRLALPDRAVEFWDSQNFGLDEMRTIVSHSHKRRKVRHKLRVHGTLHTMHSSGRRHFNGIIVNFVYMRILSEKLRWYFWRGDAASLLAEISRLGWISANYVGNTLFSLSRRMMIEELSGG